MDISKLKSPVTILAALLVISLVFAGAAFYLFQSEQAKNVALQAQLEDIKAKYRLTEAKLLESQKLASSLEAKMQDAQNQIEMLSNEIEQQRVAKQEALDDLNKLTEQLDQQKGLQSDLESKFNQSQKELERVKAQLNDLEVKKKELEVKAEEAQAKESNPGEGVELGTIVVNAPEASADEGQVLVVNKEYNFAVISLGLKDGVSIGDVFTVYHNNQNLGDVKVEKVHDSMSAAGFAATAVKEKVVEGDKVVRKK